MRFFNLSILFLAFYSLNPLLAQDKDFDLAEEYFTQMDYEKAKVTYEKLARNNRNLPLIYKNYLKTLLQLKDYKESEKIIRRQIKDNPVTASYRVDLGYLFELESKIPQADKEFEKIIEEFKKNPVTALEAANSFMRIEKIPLAENILLASRKSNKDKNLFASELADIYGLLGRQNEMIQEYINYSIENKDNLEYTKGALQDRMGKQEDFDNLERILLENLQKNPDEVVFNELLLWLYIQQKRFMRAFVQAKSLDKRYRLEGSELLNIGFISMKNEDYTSAKSIFEYIVQTYPSSGNYPIARNYYIKAKEEVVKNAFPVNLTDIQSLIQDYQNLINEIGKNYKTLEATRNMALLYAFYLDKKDIATEILNEAIQNSAGRVDFVAQCKMDLGDIYLLKDEAWESTLLYSQVEKLKKDHPLGHEAKLKNAKLSYYKGEFTLAQEHLDILKEATSREISNDALDLSLLIQDNLAFDTLGTALKDYSKIELMVFQFQNAQALQALDSMLTKFSGNSIIDEVLWSKANLELKIGKTQEALVTLEKIAKDYAEDIHGDDAYFLQAKILEEKIGDKEKAKKIYEEILTKYPGSIYVAEARKRFRILRGDFVN